MNTFSYHQPLFIVGENFYCESFFTWTGIDFSTYKDSELLKQGVMEVYTIAVKAETTILADPPSKGKDYNTNPPNSHIMWLCLKRNKVASIN